MSEFTVEQKKYRIKYAWQLFSEWKQLLEEEAVCQIPERIEEINERIELIRTYQWHNALLLASMLQIEMEKNLDE